MNLLRSRRRQPVPVLTELPPPPAWVPRIDGRAPREAVQERVAQLAQADAVDAGNGDVLDSWLDRVRADWHAEIAVERTHRLHGAEREIARLEAMADGAARNVETARDELALTERALDILTNRVLGPGEHEPVAPVERRRRPRPTLDPLEGMVRPWFHRLLLLLLILLAAAGDLATFYLVLATEFREGGPIVIIALTAAFAAAAVGLMHGVGRALKDLREHRGGLGRVAIAFLVAGWTALGAVAFFFRLESTTVAASESGPFGDTAAEAAAASHHALMSAVLLAGLFFASGLLAFYAGFSEHHPHMETYVGLRKRLPELRAAVTRTTGVAADIDRRMVHHRGEPERAAQWVADSTDTADAEIAALKELVRVEVSSHLGQPAATSGLTSGRSARHGSGLDAPGLGLPSPRPGGSGPSPADRITPASFPVHGDGASNGNGSNGHHRGR